MQKDEERELIHHSSLIVHPFFPRGAHYGECKSWSGSSLNNQPEAGRQKIGASSSPPTRWRSQAQQRDCSPGSKTGAPFPPRVLTFNLYSIASRIKPSSV